MNFSSMLVSLQLGTVQENGNGGTDHGHGNVMWVLGGKVHGGKVYGEWPGLSTDRLYQGRDLAITTDFRLGARHCVITSSQSGRRKTESSFSKLYAQAENCVDLNDVLPIETPMSMC